MMKTISLLLAFACAPPIFAQEADSARQSIHQLEAEQHRWDVLRTDRAVPAVSRGKEFARQGRYAEAEKEFRKALKTRRTIANFNLGILFYEQGRYDLALKHFDVARKAKRDPVILEYCRNARRLSKNPPVP